MKSTPNTMNDRPKLPEGIGPHEGRELELMLSGVKPLAMFSEAIPSEFPWPDDQFEPHVASGKLVKKEFLTATPDEKLTIRHLYYALPSEVWRINEAHKLSLKYFESICDESIKACAKLGQLLGYQDADIKAFTEWSKQIRATQK